jgi:hypothetical protein
MQPENSGGGIGARLRAVGAALGELAGRNRGRMAGRQRLASVARGARRSRPDVPRGTDCGHCNSHGCSRVIARLGCGNRSLCAGAGRARTFYVERAARSVRHVFRESGRASYRSGFPSNDQHRTRASAFSSGQPRSWSVLRWTGGRRRRLTRLIRGWRQFDNESPSNGKASRRSSHRSLHPGPTHVRARRFQHPVLAS